MLCEKYFECDQTNSAAWIEYAGLEIAPEDFPRAEAIFEPGVSRPSLSIPKISAMRILLAKCSKGAIRPCSWCA
ncbi:hypothetical protein BV22DRAFT_877533 [Leucogyrophana mollusca]|uniref:Uncharacterized protein n=1 Tax=Leucogyrophana mollusca TaxID=85980 RepID=A0ACB8B1L5_9AGAM|nr:hypothetical protein BV22DRAFT_877533 [Leucogyrophana mollusca]